jgi:hypothetical protein
MRWLCEDDTGHSQQPLRNAPVALCQLEPKQKPSHASFAPKPPRDTLNFANAETGTDTAIEI